MKPIFKLNWINYDNSKVLNPAKKFTVIDKGLQPIGRALLLKNSKGQQYPKYIEPENAAIHGIVVEKVKEEVVTTTTQTTGEAQVDKAEEKPKRTRRTKEQIEAEKNQ